MTISPKMTWRCHTDSWTERKLVTHWGYCFNKNRFFRRKCFLAREIQLWLQSNAVSIMPRTPDCQVKFTANTIADIDCQAQLLVQSSNCSYHHGFVPFHLIQKHHMGMMWDIMICRKCFTASWQRAFAVRCLRVVRRFYGCHSSLTNSPLEQYCPR